LELDVSLSRLIFVAAAALVLGAVVISTTAHGPSDRNVPGATTGAGRSSLAD
jgi:hypothetical protein